VETIEANVGEDRKVSGLTPWLKWAGGKRKLAPQLVEEITAINPLLYIEPFLGGGAIALALPPKLPKILADINHHLIDCWLCVQKIPGVLLAELIAVEGKYGDGSPTVPHSKEGYNLARDEFNSMIRQPRRMWARRSALFMFLNTRCFNGLWRTNAKGQFNVPWSKTDSPRVVRFDELGEYNLALKRCDLRSDGFVQLLGGELTKRSNWALGDCAKIRMMFRGVAVYVDPPYDGAFDGYAKGGFSIEDQRTLAQLLHSYASAGAAVWATNADTKLIRDAYGWAQIEEIDEHHSVGSKPERRGKRGCLLIRGGGAIQ
jgi:DNA adenine methylase